MTDLDSTCSDSMAAFRAGDLDGAVSLVQARLRDAPSDLDARVLYAELLVFKGEFDRADKALAAITGIETSSPRAAGGIALRRRLLRAEAWRQQWHLEGRIPTLFRTPSSLVEALLRANVAIREGDSSGAAAAIDEVDRLRRRPLGRCDEAPISDWRDLDDRSAGVLECFTATGEYGWIELDEIGEITFGPLELMADLLWRPAEVRTRESTMLEVHVPVLYFGSANSPDSAVKLGRTTHWTEVGDAGAVGSGQRCIWLGAEDRTILEIGRVEFERPEAATT